MLILETYRKCWLGVSVLVIIVYFLSAAVRTSDDEPFLIYSNAKLGQVKGISTDPNKTEEVIPPITDLLRPVAVDYDVKFGYIYYSDALRHRIGRRKLNERGAGNTSFIVEGKFGPFTHTVRIVIYDHYFCPSNVDYHLLSVVKFLLRFM